MKFVYSIEFRDFWYSNCPESFADGQVGDLEEFLSAVKDAHLVNECSTVEKFFPVYGDDEFWLSPIQFALLFSCKTHCNCIREDS